MGYWNSEESTCYYYPRKYSEKQVSSAVTGAARNVQKQVLSTINFMFSWKNSSDSISFTDGRTDVCSVSDVLFRWFCSWRFYISPHLSQWRRKISRFSYKSDRWKSLCMLWALSAGRCWCMCWRFCKLLRSYRSLHNPRGRKKIFKQRSLSHKLWLQITKAQVEAPV